MSTVNTRMNLNVSFTCPTTSKVIILLNIGYVFIQKYHNFYFLGKDEFLHRQTTGVICVKIITRCLSSAAAEDSLYNVFLIRNTHYSYSYRDERLPKCTWQ